MFRRKKFSMLVAMVMAVTLMFGSTVCFAAEKDEDVVETLEARTQYSTGNFSFTDGSTGITIYIRLYWAWDEGYTGWFRDAELVNLPSGELTGFSFSKTGNSSYITVNVSYKYGGKIHTASQQYYVDEYGSVY